MKEQTALTGVRKWFADDLLTIQNEIIEAQEAYFAPYGNCVIKGCEVAGQDIAAGICYIGGKIVRFAGTTGVVSFPVYFELEESISKTREYQTGGVKEIEREFKAVLNTSIPAGDYIIISSAGGRTFRDAFQDANNRMVTDSQINMWNAKEPAITKKTAFNKDKSDSVSSTNSDVLATSKAAKTAYDRGTTGINNAANALNVANAGVTDAANALSVANSKLGSTAKAADSSKLNGLIEQGALLDNTNNRLMKVGAFGIGKMYISSETDLNNYLIPGKYITPNGGLTNLPSGWTQSRQVIEVVGGQSYSMQIIGRPTENKFAMRLSSGSTFTSWVELYHSGNDSNLAKKDTTNAFTQAQTAPDFIIS